MLTDGEQLIRTNGREFCIPTKAKPTRIMCAKGQISVSTDDGFKCSDVLSSATVVCEDGKIPIETITRRECADASVPVRTASGYVCADASFPLESKSTICVSPGSKDSQIPGKPKSWSKTMCSKGQVAIPTDAGIKCADALKSATSNCTDGKVFKETITGRVCPDGSLPIRTPTGLYVCADGRVPLETRSTVCVSPDSKSSKTTTIVNSCTEDQV